MEKVALVTGSSSGIGLETSLSLASASDVSNPIPLELPVTTAIFSIPELCFNHVIVLFLPL